jgi:hypothetical protein
MMSGEELSELQEQGEKRGGRAGKVSAGKGT